MKKKIISEFPNYEIWEDGSVFNVKDNKKKKAWIAKNGYKYVDLYNNGYCKKIAIHRLLATAFIPNKENKRTVNHKDGNKLNNDLTNLEWATDSENVKHAYDNGLQPYSRKHSEKEYEDLLVNKFMKGESITSIAKYSNNKLTQLSLHLKEAAIRLGILEEYEKEIERQRRIRNKKNGLNRRDKCIIEMIDKDNGNVIKTFNNITEAKEFLNVKSHGAISNACTGRQKTAYGYKWRRK